MGRPLGLVKNADEVDVTVQSKSLEHLVLLLLIIHSPYLEVPLDAECDKHLGLRQVLDHLDGLAMDGKPTVDVV